MRFRHGQLCWWDLSQRMGLGLGSLGLSSRKIGGDGFGGLLKTWV